MSNADEIWHRKTDDEVTQAATSLDEYTTEGKRVILDELARRGLSVAVAVAPPETRVTLAEYYRRGWRNFALFRGRAGRTECFTFLIGNILIAIGLLFLVSSARETYLLDSLLVFLIAVQLPQLALNVRRLHDTGSSGWWVLISFIPLIGWIGLLAMLLKDGEAEANRYGDPQ